MAVALSGIFSGPALSAIDDKGRLAVPATLRNSIPKSDDGLMLCVTKHEKSDCLIAFGPDRLQRLLADIEREEQNAIARGQEYDRDAANRRKFGLTEQVSLDGSGRFILPPVLKMLGKLEKAVFLHGAGEYFEIWNPETLMAADDSYAPLKAAAQYLMDNGGKRK